MTQWMSVRNTPQYRGTQQEQYLIVKRCIIAYGFLGTYPFVFILILRWFIIHHSGVAFWVLFLCVYINLKVAHHSAEVPANWSSFLFFSHAHDEVPTRHWFNKILFNQLISPKRHFFLIISFYKISGPQEIHRIDKKPKKTSKLTIIFFPFLFDNTCE